MKLAISSYPFAVYSESKKSKKTGNDYTATSIKFTTKDVNGEKVSTYFNLFDKRELLVLANLCGRAFAKIDEMETLERFGDTPKKESEQKEENSSENLEEFDDEIPF